MPFSHIKIKAADHGSRSEIWVDGVKPPGLFDVNFETKVDSATVATLKMFTTVEVEGEAQVNRIIICPGCNEVHRGAMLTVSAYAKIRKRLLGIFRGLQFLGGKIIRKDITEMGDKNRKYIQT